jgi:hypothetical protein
VAVQPELEEQRLPLIWIPVPRQSLVQLQNVLADGLMRRISARFLAMIDHRHVAQAPVVRKYSVWAQKSMDRFHLTRIRVVSRDRVGAGRRTVLKLQKVA